MKKIIITFIFCLNLLPVIINKQLSISTGIQIYAQCPSTGGMVGYNNCTGCSGTGGGTSPSWWEKITDRIRTIITDIKQWIGELFGNSSNSNSYNPSNPYDQYTGYYDPNNINLGGGLTYTIYPNYVGAGSSSSGIFDCQGVDGGTAKIDVCNRCVGGFTGVDSCNAPPTNDTLKPIKIPCPPDAVARDTKSDEIFNFIKDSAITKNAIDSATFRHFEVGYAIDRYATPIGTSYYRPSHYNKSGAAQGVYITITSYSIADFHVHPPINSAGNTQIPSPSTGDFYSLLANWDWSAPSYKFQRKFVYQADVPHQEFVAVIEDTAKAHLFLINNATRNSVLNLDPNSKNVNNWKGSENEKNSLYNDFFTAYKNFQNEGYPSSMLDTYANVYMIQEKGLGIKLQEKVNGQFKELKFVKDTINGKVLYKIEICE